MNLKRKYRDLEMRVMRELRNKIEKSKHISPHLNQKAIEVNIFGYEEMAIVNGRLTFLDSRGYHYSLDLDCNLEDMIDILSKH